MIQCVFHVLSTFTNFADIYPQQAMDKLKQDEIEWQNEFGMLPAQFDRSGRSITSTDSRFTNSESRYRPTESQSGGVWLNLTEFSGYLPDNNMADAADRHFANRCGDVHEMLLARSPTKRKPIALLSDSQRSGTDYSGASGYSKKYSQGNFALRLMFPMASEIQWNSLTFCSFFGVLHRR